MGRDFDECQRTSTFLILLSYLLLRSVWLEAEVHNFFERAHAVNYDEVDVTRFETHEKGHGRIESRHVTVTNTLDWLPQKEDWSLESKIGIRSERQIGDKVEQAIRYYGSSRRAEAEEFAGWVRGNWAIDNSLHYVMDVVF